MINKYRVAALAAAPNLRSMATIKIKLLKPCPYIGAVPGEMDILKEVGEKAIEDGYAEKVAAKRKKKGE